MQRLQQRARVKSPTNFTTFGYGVPSGTRSRCRNSYAVAGTVHGVRKCGDPPSRRSTTGVGVPQEPFTRVAYVYYNAVNHQYEYFHWTLVPPQMNNTLRRQFCGASLGRSHERGI